MTTAIAVEETVRKKQRYGSKRCECHSDSGGHKFGRYLVCIRTGCCVTWRHHAVSYRLCEGGGYSNWHPSI